MPYLIRVLIIKFKIVHVDYFYFLLFHTENNGKKPFCFSGYFARLLPGTLALSIARSLFIGKFLLIF